MPTHPPTPTYDGRLELTWTNKHLRLLAHDDGAYEWVPPTDHRVAEVRLLRDAAAVGATHPARDRAKDNLLIRGDALAALTSLIELPEFAREYLGKVKLAYLDPPFNTQQSFLQYDDALEHSVWLTMMRDRLAQVKTLLAPDGSVWVHCDDSEQAYLKVMMDELFGRESFVTSFIWRKVDSPNDNKVAVTPDHEYVLCYQKTPNSARFSQMPDPSVLSAYGSMFFEIPGPDGRPVLPIHDDGREACWALGREEVFRRLKAGEIYWKQRPDLATNRKKWVPYTREWAPTMPARPWPTIWTDVLTTRQAKAHLTNLFPGVTPFATPKPEQLMARILEIGTRPGDIVLDCFVGSGTTAAVAHKMGRRWVASESNFPTLGTFTIPRLEQVVAGVDGWGISPIAGWEGGGGFRLLDLAPSMFEATPAGLLLAEWATNGRLAEAVAAQLGFDFAPDPPFTGRRGRSRLAVVDGLLNEPVVRLLVAALGPDEQLAACGTALDPAARDLLRALRPGSTARKIPASILRGYRQPARAVPPPAAPPTPPPNGESEPPPTTVAVGVGARPDAISG